MKKVMIVVITVTLFAALLAAIGSGKSLLDKEIAPSLNGSTGWANTKGLRLADLKGKVVLVDFWTYTCINWRRTLPYVREWAIKYKEHGLVVIGVHTPEFSFEKNTDNVNKAIERMKINYPVARDNNFEVWNSFHNQYWPALYLIDANGKIRYQKFGEGDYEKIELMIQQLLRETGAKNVSDKPVALHAEGAEASADWKNLKSDENYLGSNRSNGFVSHRGLTPDRQELFLASEHLNLNQWGLSGVWTIKSENISLSKWPGKIVYRFHARDLHLVMGPRTKGSHIKFRVLIDGYPPNSAHGEDINGAGYGEIIDQRMYQLIRQPEKIIDREFQIEFFDSGVEAYNFTFG